VSARTVDVLVAVAVALAGSVVLLGPAVAATSWDGLDVGVGSLDADIVLVSLMVSAVHAGLVLHRAHRVERSATGRAHALLAALDALVVLALTASLLMLFVLYWFPDEHASLAGRGYPVVALWGGIQLVAVAVAEVTARRVQGWLDHARRRSHP
jgi:hypothetical protein